VSWCPLGVRSGPLWYINHKQKHRMPVPCCVAYKNKQQEQYMEPNIAHVLCLNRRSETRRCFYTSKSHRRRLGLQAEVSPKIGTSLAFAAEYIE